MKVLVVNSHPDLSEAHIYVALRAQGMDVEVICDTAAQRSAMIEAAKVPVTHLHFQSRLDLSAIRLLRNTIRSGSFDLVHAVNKRSCTHVMAALIGMNVPVVAYRGIIGNIYRWNPETGLSYFSRKVKRIICVCEAVRQYLLSKGMSPEKVVTVYKGHNATWYKPADRRNFSEFGIPQNAFVVGCAVKISPRKGVDSLVNAIASISDMDVHLLLAGEIVYPLIPKLVQQRNIKHRVHLIGHQKNAASLMGACDCFVMPSLRREGLPRAILEAMFQGVPPIVTNIGGMPEIVEDGISGIIIPSADSDAMADAIRTLRSDHMLRKRLGIGAKERAVSHFHVDQTATAYKDIFLGATAL